MATLTCYICGEQINDNTFIMASWGMYHKQCLPHWLSREDVIAAELESPDPYSALARDRNGHWYFYDETGFGVCGPFRDMEAALAAIEEYAASL